MKTINKKKSRIIVTCTFIKRSASVLRMLTRYTLQYEMKQCFQRQMNYGCEHLCIGDY